MAKNDSVLISLAYLTDLANCSPDSITKPVCLVFAGFLQAQHYEDLQCLACRQKISHNHLDVACILTDTVLTYVHTGLTALQADQATFAEHRSRQELLQSLHADTESLQSYRDAQDRCDL